MPAGGGAAAIAESGNKQTTATDTPATQTAQKSQEPAKGGNATIVFSMFGGDETIKAAMKAYEAQHPNIKIELQDPYTADKTAEQDSQKYITTTNTAMLSGKGPDMLLLDGLPKEKYIGRHLLADLSPMLKEDSAYQQGEYFNNILDGSRTGGALYGIPLAFFIQGLYGNEDAVKKSGVQIDDKAWTWESFTQIAGQMSKQGPYKQALAIRPEGLLTQLLKEKYTQFVDEPNRKASFESDAFTGLLQQVKSMRDSGVIGDNRANNYFELSNVNSPRDYVVEINRYQSSGIPLKLFERPKGAGMKDGGSYSTFKLIGINEKSPVKQEAWEFLQFLMSYDYHGFSISKKVYANNLVKLEEQKTVKSYALDPKDEKDIPFDPAILKQLDSFLSRAVHLVPFRSSKIEEIVTKESTAFFTGQKSAQEVAKLIQNKVTTYLNE